MRKMINRIIFYKRSFFVLIFLLLPIIILKSQNVQSEQEDLFSDSSLLNIKLYADYDLIFNDRGEYAGYHDAHLLCVGNNRSYEFDVELRTRGHFRNKKDICNFPPLRINFKKKHIEGTIFEGSDKIKLVTHCNSDDPEANQNVMTEYLIYRIYNLFTDYSFRVRAAKISYVDINETTNAIIQYAFFIEKTNMIEERTGSPEFEADCFNYNFFDKPHFAVFSLFQFLIGNTDWSATIMQNVKLLYDQRKGYFIPVPYDFDLCQWVSASYASDYRDTESTVSREPFIKGYCQDYDDFKNAIEEYNKKREKIYNLVSGFDYIDKKKKNKLLSHIHDFYLVINDKNLFMENLNNYCE